MSDMRPVSLDREVDPPRAIECDQQYAEDEYELESLVDAVPEVLLDEPVLIIGRQVNLDTGVLDLLALDRWANTLVFELKRGKSDVGSASEATILSQPIAYARSLSGYDHDDLNDVYQDYCAEWDVPVAVSQRSLSLRSGMNSIQRPTTGNSVSSLSSLKTSLHERGGNARSIISRLRSG